MRKNALRNTKAQRAVIDSVSTLYLTKPVTARNILMQLKRMLSGFGGSSVEQ